MVRLCRARELLREVGEGALSLDEIARSVAISRYHFIRQFKAVFGEAPSQLRTRARLDRAKDLLVNSEDSITDICMAVGFSSLGSFSSLFANRFGQPPTLFRQRLAGDSDQLQPHCMNLLRAAWEDDSQISRSDDSRA